MAPGEHAGVIAYYLNGEKLGELPVTAAEAVERAGYLDYLQENYEKSGQVSGKKRYKDTV